MAKIIGYLRNIPAGTGQNSASVSWKKKSDDSVVASDTTAVDSYTYDSDGEFSFEQDGSPGPTYITTTYGGQTKRRGSRESGAAGTWYPAEHPYYELAHGDGVIDSVDNEMEVSAAGTMAVSVATGAALVKGHLYRCTSATAATITASDPANPRIDRVVLRLSRIGQSTEGALSIVVLAGTPGASPTAAALTQTSATWEVSLAQVRVEAAASGIAADKVTDERSYCLSYDRTLALIAAPTNIDASGTLEVDGAVTFNSTLAVDGAVTLGDTSSDSTTIYGHIKSSGTNPTVAVNTSVCGTGATAVINFGSDSNFEVEIVTGSSGFSAGRLCTVTFVVAFGSTNYIPQIQALTQDAASMIFYTSRASGTLQIFTTVAPVVSQTLRFGVRIVEEV